MNIVDYLLPPPGFPMPDHIMAPVWLLTTILLFVSAWRLSRFLFPHDGYLETIGHAVVLCWGIIVILATILGIVGVLSGPLLLVCAGLAALTLLFLFRALDDPISIDPSEAVGLFLWGTLLAYSIALVITKGLGQIPTDWDSLAYHIPFVNHWLQARSLYIPDCGRGTQPGNNELLAFWMVAPFSGDFLVALNNLPATVLFACFAYALARQMGSPPLWAHASAFVLVCQSVTLTHLITVENDVAVAASFLASVYYAFRFVENQNRAVLLFGGISIGLLAGVKFYAIGYSVLVLGIWILLTFGTTGKSAAKRVLFVGISGAMIFGGYWYIRNLLTTGSPVYPMEFFKQADTLSQLYPETGRSTFFGNRRPELLPLYLRAIWNVMGPAQLGGFVLVPLSLTWLLGSVGWMHFRGISSTPAWPRLGMVGLLVGTGLLLGITPFAVEDDPGTLNQLSWSWPYCPVRYGLCFSIATLTGILLLRDLVSLLLNARRRQENSVSTVRVSTRSRYPLSYSTCSGSHCRISTLSRRAAPVD